eukprot:TRINITY_DN884_c0_g3_i1.p1 TRINITY_DN884_c0_g3~~TRINITY_DN884_c0_g3_i1.p1  ORF type:complete len:458 (+),score=116.85 TRINITY_DN884_c0_g3_i1:53-1426(+)
MSKELARHKKLRQLQQKKKKELRPTFEAIVNAEKKAFQIQENLIEPGVSLDYLNSVIDYLYPTHYVDVIEERTTDKICGYPPCSNPLPKNILAKYTISVSKHTVYENIDRAHFCSDECLVNSRLFQAKLSEEPIHLRTLKPESLRIEIKERDVSQDVVKAPSLDTTHLVEIDVKKQTQKAGTAKKGKMVKFDASAVTDKQKVDTGSRSKVPLQLSIKEREVTEISEKLPALELEEDTENTKPTPKLTEKKKKNKEIQIKLSPFGLLWSTLSDWYTSATGNFLRELATKAQREENEKEEEKKENEKKEAEGDVVPDLEDLWKDPSEEAVDERASALALGIHVPTQQNKRLEVLSAMIAKQLPEITQRVGFRVAIDAHLSGLVRTFRLEKALPTLSPPLWSILTLILFHVISVHCETLMVDLRQAKKENHNKESPYRRAARICYGLDGASFDTIITIFQ